MRTLLFLALLTFQFNLFAQETNPNLDTLLAAKLGADDYGMKKYVFVLLTTGQNTTTDKSFRDSCFASHMVNIGSLVSAGKLVVAGPFMKNDASFRGLFILDVPTIEEAQSLMLGDAAIQSGILAPQYFFWYGSAALPEYLPVSDKVWRIKP